MWLIRRKLIHKDQFPCLSGETLHEETEIALIAGDAPFIIIVLGFDDSIQKCCIRKHEI